MGIGLQGLQVPWVALSAELQALKDGLLLAQQWGISSYSVKLNVEIIIGMIINSYNNQVMDMEPLLSDCKNLQRKFPNLTIKHAFHEENQNADGLANLGNYQTLDFVIFDNQQTVLVLFGF